MDLISYLREHGEDDCTRPVEDPWECIPRCYEDPEDLRDADFRDMDQGWGV